MEPFKSLALAAMCFLLVVTYLDRQWWKRQTYEVLADYKRAVLSQSPTREQREAALALVKMVSELNAENELCKRSCRADR